VCHFSISTDLRQVLILIHEVPRQVAQVVHVDGAASMCHAETRMSRLCVSQHRHIGNDSLPAGRSGSMDLDVGTTGWKPPAWKDVFYGKSRQCERALLLAKVAAAAPARFPASASKGRISIADRKVSYCSRTPLRILRPEHSHPNFIGRYRREATAPPTGLRPRSHHQDRSPPAAWHAPQSARAHMCTKSESTSARSRLTRKLYVTGETKVGSRNKPS
jgi:hypothetical protein